MFTLSKALVLGMKDAITMELRYYSSPWQQVNKRQHLHFNPVDVEKLMHEYAYSANEKTHSKNSFIEGKSVTKLTQ